MKNLFVAIGAILLVAGALTRWTEPDLRSDVPVIYWVSDPNPLRAEQIRLFHEWLVANGHTTPAGKPCVELRLDASGGNEKQLIQGISGIAGDVMDCDIVQFQGYGLLADVTEEARKYGFDAGHTHAALMPLLAVDGRQYGFPCNVWVMNFWVNVDVFQKYGMEPPPTDWNLETFERIGKEFVKRANPPEKRRTVFLCPGILGWQGRVLIPIMTQSMGLSIFNETFTQCTLDDERYARVLELVRKWTYEDRILPTAADTASFAAVSGGYGGSEFSLFLHGQYAMLPMGRWLLIQVRKMDESKRPRLAISHIPCEEFRNTIISTRAAGVYAAGRHRDMAALFLAFLASREYNEHIASAADSLPPDPRFMKADSILRPPEYPNEWGCHEADLATSETIAITFRPSPFLPPALTDLAMRTALEQVMNSSASPKQAAAEAARRINEDMRRALKESAALRGQYEEACRMQEKIRARRSEGKPVPKEWIANPFHVRYYAHKGWSE